MGCWPQITIMLLFGIAAGFILSSILHERVATFLEPSDQAVDRIVRYVVGLLEPKEFGQRGEDQTRLYMESLAAELRELGVNVDRIKARVP